jgi:hypothetical protein
MVTPHVVENPKRWMVAGSARAAGGAHGSGQLELAATSLLLERGQRPVRSTAAAVDAAPTRGWGRT